MPRWTVRLPEDMSAPGVAREAIDEWLRDVNRGVHCDARSVVSELVLNAVRQGGAPFELSVEQRGDRVRIEVADGGEPTGRRPPEGWAQRIVDALAARWGVRGDDAHVWFELALGHDDESDDSRSNTAIRL